ncbi:MAG: TauD/TfdA family dioxygenase [Proteobacteria bacterium]|nr:TauD/TfdA family dioxygenase [Pseudomonadota bacterium]MDA1325293.1 TauD/TfdA family dioxygenase [Pseudomonadota bacterium]
MAPTARYEPISAPWVWTAVELAARDDWIFPLSAAALDDMDRALADVKRRGLAMDTITAADFPLPSFTSDLADINASLADGPGISLVRGVPVDRYDRDDLRLILWGIGAHIGLGAPQSFRGDKIGDVMDMSHTGDIRRSYRSPRPLYLHVDPIDIVGLLCTRQAKEGGWSLLTSAAALHNTLLAERPDLMPALYRGFHYSSTEASSTGEPPLTSYRIPVYRPVGDQIAVNFNASPIDKALAHDDIEEDAAALEAFELFKETAMRDDLVFRTMLEPGDLQFLNNRIVLHGRTRFEDFPELERKRHMLRVWLKMPGWVPWPDNMYWHEKGYRLSEDLGRRNDNTQGERT